MGIEVQKSAIPTFFNFARVRAAPQPHVKYDFKVFGQEFVFWPIVGYVPRAVDMMGYAIAAVTTASCVR